MKHILTTVLAGAALAGVTALAQPGGRGGMGQPAGLSAMMIKVFGENKAFTATIEATMQNPSLSGPMTVETTMVMLDGKVRMDADMSKMKGANMPAQQMAQLKQMGMDKTVNIIRPDQKISYNIFPGMKAYAAVAMTDKEIADAMNDTKLEKTSLGKETIDGHPCEKNKVTMTGENGEKQEVLVWSASDLKNFPVQMQMEENGNKVTMKYTDIKLEKPDAKLFDPPADFKKYDNMQKLMQTELMKRAGASRG